MFERVNLIKSDLAFIRFLSFKFALVMSKNKFPKWKSYVSKTKYTLAACRVFEWKCGNP